MLVKKSTGLDESMNIVVVASAILLALDRDMQRTMSALYPITEQEGIAKRPHTQQGINIRTAAMPRWPANQRIRYPSRGAKRHH